VTALAIPRETRRRVIGIARRRELADVAALALHRASDELQQSLLLPRMAALAVGGAMGAFEGEPRCLVPLQHQAAVEEAPLGVAGAAVGAQFPTMLVLVAGGAGRRGAGKGQVQMPPHAVGRPMRPDLRIA
jgi:hypothetical protein